MIFCDKFAQKPNIAQNSNILDNHDSLSRRRGSTHSNGSLNDNDFEKLKQEILSEIKIQLNEVKLEIIEGESVSEVLGLKVAHISGKMSLCT